MSSTVRVFTLDSGRVALVSPYNAELIEGARDLGGDWDGASRHWHFDGRDEVRVRELARTIFGTDGSAEQEGDTVTVRWAIEGLATAKGDNELTLGGRRIAVRRGRDERVRLARGVVIIAGGFPAAAGSMRYPALAPQDGTVLEIRDFPRSAVPTDDPDITIVDEDEVDVEKLTAELTAERTQLLDRLAQIDATLAELAADQG
ncbi:hypothetical protein GTW37_32775 [Streptomyces sp. SID4931]|nr:hypothetical protein [Streptomyces sp. SID4931]SCG07153.1 hypothetical protein GA0115255_122275 [Streptomyces sp. Ncost-T6T-2b]